MVIDNMKGQSAIEYLTTYGWMILAVAVVSGVAYSSIQSSCTRSFSDFYTDSVDVQNFGLDGSGDLLLSVHNSGYSEIKFNSINVTVNEDHRQEDLELNLTSGSSGQIRVEGFRATGTCNTLDVSLNLDRGTLGDQEVTGIIRASIDTRN